MFSQIVSNGGNYTVLSLVEKYVSLKIGVRHNTKAGYKTVINILKKDPFGNKRIDRVKLSDAKAWLIKLQQVDGRGYSSIHTITPTDDPRTEFAKVRERVQNGELFLFPLGIGAGADMARLRDMFPVGKVPQSFSERYKMIRPDDYGIIFKEIKDHVKRKQSVMVSEGNSIQSAPAVEDININNNQMGESIMYRYLSGLA